ncbi:MAG: sialate O-acetylesterase, partial [Lentisphaerae bacterium]|nr:sialate O-acetylesterase [Lentisphaerota bacterium]
VVVAFKGASVSGKADAQGRWRILLPVFAADATSAVMTIRGATNAVAVADVVVGDVFLAGGQSNMEVPV